MKGSSLAWENALEPIALDLGPMRRTRPGARVLRGDWSTLEVRLIHSFALEQKGDPMKLEPFLEHSLSDATPLELAGGDLRCRRP